MMAMEMEEHFAMLDGERDDPKVGPWIEAEIIPPWYSVGRSRIRRYHDSIDVELHVAGGEDGTPAARLPSTMNPEEERMISWSNGGAIQLLKTGEIVAWKENQ